jgi:hypothetical protein
MTIHSALTRGGLQLAAALALSLTVASSLSAQRIPDLNAPKRAAQNAANAENARLSAQTGQALPGSRSAPVSGPGSTAPAQGTAVMSASASSTMIAGALAPVTREVFGYQADGRRDPFFSLILTEELRPLLSDLKLVGILYEGSGRRSVAIMRDQLTNAQYRVNAGATLGRMRVAQIKPRAVIFTIDEFGLSRQDSLFLADTTKMRMP